MQFQQAVMTFIGSHLTTRDERVRLSKIFQKLDKNKDGQLSKEEIIEGYKEIFKDEALCERKAEKIMQQLDTNQSGFIDYNEFITGSLDKKQALNKKNLEVAFKLFDKDGDGHITKQEIIDVIGGELSDIDNVMWQDIINQADTNNDGVISFEEFCTLMLKFTEQSVSLSQEN